MVFSAGANQLAGTLPDALTSMKNVEESLCQGQQLVRRKT